MSASKIKARSNCSSIGNKGETDTVKYVPVHIKLTAHVDNWQSPKEVKKELFEVFSNKVLPDGRKGFFHPDNFVCGQGLSLSSVYATALKVDGVVSVRAESFERVRKRNQQEFRNGVIKTGPDEVIRLDNNPDSPENGMIEFDLRDAYALSSLEKGKG